MTASDQTCTKEVVMRGATPPAAPCGVSVTGFGGRSPHYHQMN
jgi:hypothetical protein